MLKQNSFFLFIITVFNLGQAQNDAVVLKGKIVANSKDLEAINIINLQSEATTSTDKSGNFEINVFVGNTLVFSGIQFERKEIIITKEDLNLENINVNLNLNVRQIEEVVIDNKINAVSLGIVPKNQKKYTVAERRLYTATGGKNVYGTSTKISLDGIINAISGRTSMLKKGLIIERKEFSMLKINDWFEDSYYTETLKIPSEYIMAFKYYLIENENFKAAIKNKNKTLATFLIGEIATEYLNLLNEK